MAARSGTNPTATRTLVRWTEHGVERAARWRSEAGAPAPVRVVLADNRTRADDAHRNVCEGTALLWRGDFAAARQLLDAVARRIDRGPRRPRRRGRRGQSDLTGVAPTATEDDAATFHQQRKFRAQRARRLGMVLVALDADLSVPLARAPDVRAACAEVYGRADEPSVVALRELLGVISAHEWRRRGIWVPALDARVHPHYGVFAPTRPEYVELVADAPLPEGLAESGTAFDIGTGTGILAAVLARRGLARVAATDHDPRALTCAQENIKRLGYADRVEIQREDLFPPGRAGLVVCNPPWMPARPSSRLDQAVYDPGGRMLHGFLDGLAAHLAPGGQGWLVLSDLAEHLGLRARAELLATFDAAGLRVLDRHEVPARNPRARDENDPLHTARAAELVSLWRLGAQ